MMAERNPLEDVNLAFVIGEMRGQLKELIHAMVNRTSAEQARDDILARLRGVPDDIKEINASLKSLTERVSALEGQETRRVVERGILASVVNSRAVGWAVGVAGVLYVWLSDKFS